MGIYEALRSPVGKGQRRHGKKGLVPFGNRIYEGTTRGGDPKMARVQPPLTQQTGTTGDSTPPVKRKSLRCVVGMLLMAGSFLVYPAYPVILLWLPLSISAKATASVVVWLGSWGAFSLGAYLAGPEGYAWFKRLWQRMTARRV